MNLNPNLTMTRRGALALITSAGAAVACLSIRPGFALANGTALDTLLRLIGERLAVMPDVSRHKYNSGAAVEDLPREAQVIEAVTAQAVEAGLDKDLAAKFFQAQIDASKMIQSERIAAWKAENHAPFVDVPDLRTVIRPKLDALTPALVAALKDALPELKISGIGARLEAYTAGRGGEDEAAFRRAIAPLITAGLYKNRKEALSFKSKQHRQNSTKLFYSAEG
jgi:chorismate mutase